MTPFDLHIFICLYIQTKFNNYSNVFFLKLHSYLKYFLILLKKNIYIYILDIKFAYSVYLFSQKSLNIILQENFT